MAIKLYCFNANFLTAYPNFIDTIVRVSYFVINVVGTELIQRIFWRAAGNR